MYQISCVTMDVSCIFLCNISESMLSGSLSPRHGAASGCRQNRQPPNINVAVHILIRCTQPTKGGLPG